MEEADFVGSYTTYYILSPLIHSKIYVKRSISISIASESSHEISSRSQAEVERRKDQ